MATSRFSALPWPLPLYAVAAVAAVIVATAVAVDISSLLPAVTPKLAPRIEMKATAKAKPAKTKVKPALSAFQKEQAMNFGQLMRRWYPLIAAASKRFGVPQTWLRAVMQMESGGRTMLSQTEPMISSQGAMGLMQLMPETYREMRAQYALGGDPFDPHDNIFAAAAYLRWLRSKYGYPTMFAAYNDGPGNLEARLLRGGMLPTETQLYVANVTGAVAGLPRGMRGVTVKLTRPDGQPVMIDAGAVSAIRPAFPDEYAPGVLTVITVGRLRQGVRESPALSKALIRTHGGAI